VNDHILLAATGFGKAFSFLKDRLNGVQPAGSNCQ
jgi:hypothetical protein